MGVQLSKINVPKLLAAVLLVVFTFAAPVPWWWKLAGWIWYLGTD